MSNCFKLLYFILFADDTNIFLSDDKLSNLIKIVNNELVHLCNWFRANKLSLNISKINFIIFGNKCDAYRSNPIIVLIDGKRISQASHCKFLGIIIDERLSWSCHILIISTKKILKISVC